MNLRNPRVGIWAIWGMVVAYAFIQVVAWGLSGGVPRRPLVLVQVVGAWLIMLILGVVTTRLIGGLSRTLSEQQHEHRATVNEVEELQIQNEMLQIISRSVDVPLAFQALARRIARIVPCERVGLALLSEDGTEFQTYTAREHKEEQRSRPRPEVVFRTKLSAFSVVFRS